jgi:hypothetical protein
MAQFQRIAVILAGEYRTWPIVNRYLFELFQDRAEQVDYYFVTWNYVGIPQDDGSVLAVTDSDILQPFQQYGKTLVAYRILEPIGKKATTFYNQAYLAKVANILKRQQERRDGFVYDQVVETRHDIFLYKGTRTPWEPCREYEIESNGVHDRNQMEDGFAYVDDFYYRSTSFTNDIMANRYSFRNDVEYYNTSKLVDNIDRFHSNHYLLRKYIDLKHITVRSQGDRDYDMMTAIRPNFPTSVDFNSLPLDQLHLLFDIYGKPNEEKFFNVGSPHPIEHH